MQARLRADQVVYARASTHVGNSLIMFYPGGSWSAEPTPGTIEYIFTDGGPLRFAVQRYLPAKLVGPDPFAQWADFPAKSWSTTLGEELKEVEVEWIMSHFARC
jgi:hypothetical protein